MGPACTTSTRAARRSRGHSIARWWRSWACVIWGWGAGTTPWYARRGCPRRSRKRSSSCFPIRRPCSRARTASGAMRAASRGGSRPFSENGRGSRESTPHALSDFVVRRPRLRIHFLPSYRSVALVEAREAERAYRLLATELHPPRGVVDITLADDIDASNGFTSVVPTSRITIYAAPPAGDHGLLFFDSWLRLVTTHELAHVFHLDRTKGIWRPLQAVFGRAPGLFPNEYQPSWVIEGLATYYESKFTSGGRVRGSFHTQLLEADQAAGSSRPPWDATLYTRWPDGLVPYAYGSRFLHYLAGTAGDSVVPRLVESTSAQWIPFRVGRQLSRVVPGRSLGAEWKLGTQPARGSEPAAAAPRVIDSL